MRTALVSVLVACGSPPSDSAAPTTDAVAVESGCLDTGCAGAPLDPSWRPTDVAWSVELALDDAGRPRTWGAGTHERPSGLTVHLREGAGRRLDVLYRVEADDLVVAGAGPADLRAFLAETGLPFGFRVTPDQLVPVATDSEDTWADLDVRGEPVDGRPAAVLVPRGPGAPLLLVGLGGVPSAEALASAARDGIDPAKVAGGVLRVPFDVPVTEAPSDAVHAVDPRAEAPSVRDVPLVVVRALLDARGVPARDPDLVLEDAATVRTGGRPSPGYLQAEAVYTLTR